MKKLTYLLGAGASYHSCPIWKEQAEKMIEIAEDNLDKDISLDNLDNLKDPKMEILRDIGYFGKKALEFGTIDTYAKKLLLNQSNRELQKLKLAVNLFFTLWQFSRNSSFKSRSGTGFDFIDKRYISLFASIVERRRGELGISDNINFVTWNYDLQLELAFKSFNHDSSTWDLIKQNLKFSSYDNHSDKLQICHLNGYHGFYKTEAKEIDFMTQYENLEIRDIIESLSFIPVSQSRHQLNIVNHINYAWESNEMANFARKEAQRIFSDTDILIIIGYSFPPFNKDIDKQLFSSLKEGVTIYYQDPNATDTFLNHLVSNESYELTCDREKMDYFYLPYEY